MRERSHHLLQFSLLPVLFAPPHTRLANTGLDGSELGAGYAQFPLAQRLKNQTHGTVLETDVLFIRFILRGLVQQHLSDEVWLLNAEKIYSMIENNPA